MCDDSLIAFLTMNAMSNIDSYYVQEQRNANAFGVLLLKSVGRAVEQNQIKVRVSGRANKAEYVIPPQKRASVHGK